MTAGREGWPPRGVTDAPDRIRRTGRLATTPYGTRPVGVEDAAGPQIVLSSADGRSWPGQPGIHSVGRSEAGVSHRRGGRRRRGTRFPFPGQGLAGAIATEADPGPCSQHPIGRSSSSRCGRPAVLAPDRLMMASIERRPDGRYRARWREVPGGPQRTKHFDRKADAERLLDRVRGDLASGLYIDPSAGRIPFSEYAESSRASQVHRPSTQGRHWRRTQHLDNQQAGAALIPLPLEADRRADHTLEGPPTLASGAKGVPASTLHAQPVAAASRSRSRPGYVAELRPRVVDAMRSRGLFGARGSGIQP